jgi:hypothetical protein
MYLLWNQTCNIYSKVLQCYDTHSRHTVSEGLNILQDILLQFVVTFSFVIGKMRYFDGVQSGIKNTLYHLPSLLFHVFFGHLCYQNIHISQKYILIADVLQSVILSCNVCFSQYCDRWYFRLIVHSSTLGSAVLTHYVKLQQFNALLKTNNRLKFAVPWSYGRNTFQILYKCR